MYLTKQIIHLLRTQLTEKSKQYEDGWKRCIHKPPHDRNIKTWLTTEEHCLVNLYQSLFPPISSCTWCLRRSAIFQIRVPAYSSTSYYSSSFEITIQEPYFSTFMTPIPQRTPVVTEWLLLQTLPIAKATVQKDENNICLYSPMVTKVPLFFGA